MHSNINTTQKPGEVKRTKTSCIPSKKPYVSRVDLEELRQRSVLLDLITPHVEEELITSLKASLLSPLAHRHKIIPQTKYSTKKLKNMVLDRHEAFPEMGIADFVKTFASMPEYVNASAAAISGTAPVFVQGLETLSNTANHIDSTIIDAKAQMSKVYDWLGNVHDSAFLTLGLVSSIFCLYSYSKQPKNKSTLIMGSMIGMMVVGKIAHACREEASEVVSQFTAMLSVDDSLQMEEMATPEFGIDSIQRIVQAIVACVTVYISTESGVKIPEKLFKNFTSMDRVTATVSGVLTTFITCIESITNYIREKLLGKSSLSFLNANCVKIDEYLDKTREIARLHQMAQFPKDQTNLNILESLSLEGESLLANSIRDKSSSGVLDIIKAQVNDVNKLVSAFREAQLHTRGIRQEPVSVMFAGGAGTGKSVTMQYLSSAVLGKILSEDEFALFERKPSDFIFNRQAESVYWDGMDTQMITTFDDFGQALDVAGSPDNEYMNFIRCVNTYEYDMHTAQMIKKGNSKFHSKFVFATTNRVQFHPESIFSADALTRRIDFNFIVAPKRAHTVKGTENLDLYQRKLDRSTLKVCTLYDDEYEENVTSTVLDPSVQEYHYVNHSGKPTGEIIDFNELVDRVVAKYKQKRGWHLHAVYDLKKVASCNRTSNLISALAFPEMNSRALIEYLSSPQFEDPVWQDEYMTQVCLIDQTETYAGASGQYSGAAQLVFGPNHPYNNALDIFLATFICFQLEGIKEKSVHEYLMSQEFDGDYPSSYNDTPYIASYLVKVETPSFMETLKGSLASFYEGVALPKLCQIGTFLKENPLIIFGGAALLGAIFASSMSTPTTVIGEPIPESVGSETKMGKKTPKKMVRSLKNRTVPEISHNNAHICLAMGLERTNVFQLYGINAKGEEQRYGYVTFIKGVVAIVPLHFIRVFEYRIAEDSNYASTLLFLSNQGYSSAHRSVFTVGELVKGAKIGLLEANDLVLVKFPDTVQPKRDITSFFVNEADLVNLEGNVPFDLRLPGQSNKSYVGIAQPRDKHLAVSSEEAGSYTVRYQYEYKNFTKSGDCGGLFTVIRPDFGKRVIAGIHVAACAAASRSYAASLCLEDIEEDLILFDTIHLNSVEEVVVDNTIPQISLPEGKFEVVGTVKVRPAAPTNSAINRSKLHGKWGPSKQAPALLRPKIVGDSVIDPLLLAHNKYGHPPVYVNPEDISKVVPEVLKSIGMADRHRVKVFTTMELLYGQDGEEYLSSLPTETSAGYPMNIQGQRNVKKEFFSHTRGSPEQLVVLQDIESELESLESKYRSGVIPQWVFTDNLKDERRPLAKVASGSTRKFSGCPFYYLLLLRKYFGAFVGHTKETRINNSIAVGVNVYSDEWTTIVDHLSHFVQKPSAPKVGAGDFSAFDGHQLVSVHLGILDVVCRWYSLHGDGHNNEMRRMLYTGILNSLHISDGTLFFILGNMSSGVYGTSCWNSLYNIFSFRLAFRSVYPELKFSEHVRLIVFGDDNVYSTSEFVKEKFNELTLPHLMRELGQVYTREDKMTAMSTNRNLYEIDFLKRAFIYDPSVDRYVAPLNLDVILEIPYWTKSGERGINITISNVGAAIRELSLHPKDIYDRYAGRMVEALTSEFPPSDYFYDEIIFKSYSEIREEVLDDESYLF
jgi:hypothetical protein